MTFQGRDIWKVRVPRSGIRYSPLLSWIFAAQWANYTTEEFLELDGDMQTLIVEAYNAHMQIEAVLSNEQAKKLKARASAPAPRSARHSRRRR